MRKDFQPIGGKLGGKPGMVFSIDVVVTETEHDKVEIIIIIIIYHYTYGARGYEVATNIHDGTPPAPGLLFHLLNGSSSF